jgi:hypothetical protein
MKYPRFSWSGGVEGGRQYSARPSPFYSRLLDRYLKTTQTVFLPLICFKLDALLFNIVYSAHTVSSSLPW